MTISVPVPVSNGSTTEPIKETGTTFLSALRNPVPYSLWEIGKRVFRGDLGNSSSTNHHNHNNHNHNQQSQRIMHFDVNSSDHINETE